MNQTEIDELRRLHENHEQDHPELGSFYCRGCKKLHTRCQCADMAWDALPRLLAALEEARAERDKANLRERNMLAALRIALGEDLGGGGGLVEILNGIEGLQEHRDAAESLAWDALGRPEGTHDTSNVQRLCEAHGALKAKLAHAEAEAAGYQKLAQACKDEDGKTVVVIIQGESEVRVFGPNSDCEERFGEVVVRWWKLLDTVVESKAFDALKAERDAIKATLAKHAESERTWCEMATERGAKLAALVEAMEHIRDIMGGHDGCQGFSSPEDVWGIADKALAAAKVQP